MIHIAYESDHANRAQKLAVAIAGATFGLVTDPPTKRPGMDTLIYWGHGTQGFLCGLTPELLVKNIRAWKSLNSKLETVEIITCDSRHAAGGQDPYVKQVKSLLRSRLIGGGRNLVVKALPVHVGGSTNSASILLADWETNSWCYVTAPSTAEMFKSKTMVIKEAKANFHVNVGPHGVPGDDVAQAADTLIKAHPQRTFTLNYGYFNTLRSQLGVIH